MLTSLCTIKYLWYMQVVVGTVFRVETETKQGKAAVVVVVGCEGKNVFDFVIVELKN